MDEYTRLLTSTDEKNTKSPGSVSFIHNYDDPPSYSQHDIIQQSFERKEIDNVNISQDIYYQQYLTVSIPDYPYPDLVLSNTVPIPPFAQTFRYLSLISLAISIFSPIGMILSLIALCYSLKSKSLYAARNFSSGRAKGYSAKKFAITSIFFNVFCYIFVIALSITCIPL
jgi:hypothetical protein